MADENSYDVFLSYPFSEREAIARISDRLHGAGIRAIRFDDFPPGSDISARTSQLVKEAKVAVFFISGSGIGPGQANELNLLRDRRELAIIPVLLPAASEKHVPVELRSNIWVDFTSGLDDESAYQQLERAIRTYIAAAGAEGSERHPPSSEHKEVRPPEEAQSGASPDGGSAGPDPVHLKPGAAQLVENAPQAASGVISPHREIPELSIRNASTSDQPTNDDRLGFTPYVDAMAGFLLNEETRPPLTVSIEGEWGSGKSSFMLQLEKTLRDKMAEQRRDWWWSLPVRLASALWRTGTEERAALRRELRLPACLTLRFNAWRHDKEDALWAAFALDFVEKIARQRFFLRRWWGHLRLFSLRYSWRTGGLHLARFLLAWVLLLVLGIAVPIALFHGSSPRATQLYVWMSELALAPKDPSLPDLFGKLGLSGVAIYYALFLVLLQRGKGLLGNPLEADLKKYLSTPDYAGRVAFVEAFHEDFERIVRAYVGSNKVFVFVDDLDRCEVPKAADLMQALNLMIADDPHLVFLLGMDRKKVAAGLAVKYDKLLPYLAAPEPQVAPEPDAKPRSRDEEATLAAQRGLDFGYEFLHKFIQLPFRVPSPRPDDLRLFLGSLSGASALALPSLGAAELAERPFLRFQARDDEEIEAFIEVEDPSEPPSSLPAPIETPEEQEARRRELRLLLGTDSDLVREAGLMARQVLGGNPRRLKQFINLFRLRAHIASETGLFSGEEARTVTIQQLAKLVALELAFPGLIFDLGDDPQLLRSLQRFAIGQTVDAPRTVPFGRWHREPLLRRLLQFGLALQPDPSQPQPADYSLEHLPIDTLLQTSPRVVRSAQRIRPADTLPSKSQAASYNAERRPNN